MAIGERLREERLRLNATQAALAKIGGIGVSSLKMYEGNEREPGASFLAALSEAGADVLYILTGTRDMGSSLSSEEEVLLDNYRANTEEGKRAIRGAASAWTEPRVKKGAA